ncbi:hypothetical protein Pmar_PMAR020024, partial [Perkinsus marinus ATCC 50983]
MSARLGVLSTILVCVITFGEGVLDRTLLRISHRGAPLDIRLVPKMLAQATAASDRVVYPLSVDDLECERCFAQDGAILDLKAVGIQIVESTCSVGHSQILGYLQKAKTMLDIDFDCDPDYE